MELFIPVLLCLRYLWLTLNPDFTQNNIYLRKERKVGKDKETERVGVCERKMSI